MSAMCANLCARWNFVPGGARKVDVEMGEKDRNLGGASAEGAAAEENIGRVS